MNNFKHLTENQLLAYVDDSLPQNELFEIGRHLIQCPFCRKSLPNLGINEFRSAIMNEWKNNEISNESVSRQGFFSLLNSYWIIGAAGLIIVLTFSILIWKNEKTPLRNNPENFNNETVAKVKFPSPAPNRINTNTESQSDSKKGTVNKNPKDFVSDTSKNKFGSNAFKSDKREKDAHVRKENISAARGASSLCAEGEEIGLDFRYSKDGVVFRWRKIKGAIKYHLFVSDENEILIEEFESRDETSFVLKKPLDSQKVYNWKIVVTLENGQTIIGNSRRFNIEGIKSSKNMPVKEGNFNTRCFANTRRIS